MGIVEGKTSYFPPPPPPPPPPALATAETDQDIAALLAQWLAEQANQIVTIAAGTSSPTGPTIGPIVFPDIGAAFQDAIARLQRSIEDKLRPLFDIGQALWRLVRDLLPPWISTLLSFLLGLPGRVWKGAMDFLGRLFPYLSAFGQILATALSPILVGVAKFISDPLGTIVGALRAAPETIRGFLQQGWQIFTTTFWSIIDFVKGWIELRLRQAWATLKAVLDVIPQLLPALFKALKKNLDILDPENLEKAAQRVREVVSPIISQVMDGVGGLIYRFTDSIPHNTGLVPSAALGAVPPILLLAFGAGTVAHILSTAISLIPTVSGTGVAQFAGFIAEFGAFGPAVAATYGSALRTAVARPLEHHFMHEFRPTVPSIRDAVEMRLERTISDGTFRTIMSFWGWPDPYINALEKQMWFDGRTRDLILIADADVADWGWIESKVVQQGWEDADVPKVVEAIRNRTMQKDRELLVLAADNLYKEGFMNPGEYSAILAGTNKTPEQISWRLRAMNLKLRLEISEDFAKTAEEDYKDDVIDTAALTDRLAAAGLRPERAQSRTRLAVAKKFKQPRPAKAPREDPVQREVRRLNTQATVQFFRFWTDELRGALKQDLITADEFDFQTQALTRDLERSLLDLGYTKEHVEGTVTLELLRADLVPSPFAALPPGQ